MITPIEKHGDLWIKREDTACDIGPDHAAGAKVRQYLAMCAKASPTASLVVGCSAYSCQQVYIADARIRTGRDAVVFVAARKEVTAATQFCIDVGCRMEYVRPGYLSVVRSRAKAWTKAHDCVRWSPAIASADAYEQALHYTGGRIVVPVGSGAMLAGILAALAKRPKPPHVLGVRVSPMADYESITVAAQKIDEGVEVPPFELVDYPAPYDRGRFGIEVDGIHLDPWYAAKALKFVGPGDCLWNTGRRPITIMR